ncbi:diguanylate cyclase [Ideonella sp. DXS29W]|uniref:diguanylate cyclase n=1 Tax=Ideonella lacteola TaxID=2984193 RepID=A0ABU9BLI7_9BURK
MTSDIGPLQAARAALEAGNMHQASLLAGAAFRAAAQADDHGRAEAGYLLCMAQFRLGRWPAVLESGEASSPLLHRIGAIVRQVEVLRWVTIAASELGRFDLALASANESCRVAEAAGERVPLALSLMALGVCIERMGDPWQAHRLVEEARVLLQGENSPYAQSMILNNLCASYLGAFYLLRDGAAPAEARAVLEKAVGHAREALPLMAQLPNNGILSAIIEGNLAESLVHLGQCDEAEQLLDRALGRVNEQGNTSHGWRLRYARGELLLARGDAAGASRELSALWQDLDGSEQSNTLTRVHDALYRSWRALGVHARALAHLEGFEALERRRVVAQLQAQSRLFVTRVEAERARLEAQVERLRAAEFEADAQRDELTGLGNRRHLERRLPPLLAAAAASGHPLSVALVDLDHFKHVNDRHGHAAGDRVLTVIADLLRAHTRATDLLVRLGGEEFLIVFTDTDIHAAQEVSERLRERVESHDWTHVAPGVVVTLSVGLTTAPPYDLAALSHSADLALYRAKRAGRNRVVVCNDGG